MSASAQRQTVVLCGPSTQLDAGGYGGGKGGFVRNVDALLEHFSDGDVTMTLSPYSTRRFSRWWMVMLPLRLVSDLRVFVRNIRRGAAVHMMMTYGMAIYREFGMSLIAALLRRPVILDIRGGSFVPWLESAGWMKRAMAHWSLRHAEIVLGQGRAVVSYLRPLYGEKVHHFPNFVQKRYWPAEVPRRCRSRELAVIFVGYCYDGKGVFELVEGCSRAVLCGMSMRLTLVGAESADFKRFLDGYAAPAGLTIERRGTLDFDAVQEVLSRSDVFCFPTRHFGEGHPNAITEAMAHGVTIVTTRHGFIPELLDESTAYFVEPGSAQAIADALVRIDANREEACDKASKARAEVAARFSEAGVLGNLREHYQRVLRRSTTLGGK